MNPQAALLTTLLSGLLPAQIARTEAYPQGTLTMSHTHLVPLGSLGQTSNFEEGRWQQLIPATHLPSVATQLTGLEFHCPTYSGTVQYGSLRIAVSHAAFADLGPVFASNLPAPTQVLDATGFTVRWYPGAWVRIGFTTPFAYSGSNGIVIDIRKAITPIASGFVAMQTDSDPGRTDLPKARYAFGTFGSGAANAPAALAATEPLSMRLVWADKPAFSLISDRLLTGARNVFALTGSLGLVCDTQAGASWFAFADVGFVPRYSVPGILGHAVVQPALVFPLRTSLSAPDFFFVPIPDLPSLVDQRLCLQALVLDPRQWPEPHLTNATDCVLRGK